MAVLELLLVFSIIEYGLVLQIYALANLAHTVLFCNMSTDARRKGPRKRKVPEFKSTLKHSLLQVPGKGKGSPYYCYKEVPLPDEGYWPVVGVRENLQYIYEDNFLKEFISSSVVAVEGVDVTEQSVTIHGSESGLFGFFKDADIVVKNKNPDDNSALAETVLQVYFCQLSYAQFEDEMDSYETNSE